MAGSEAAAAKWSEQEKSEVRAVIELLARRRPTFTADDVWEMLGPAFRVTKGLASQLNRAAKLGLIEATNTFIIAERDGKHLPHNHAQRLLVWRSRIYRESGAEAPKGIAA